MIDWRNNSALSGFKDALAAGADIGDSIRKSRENSALSAYLGSASAPSMGGQGIVATPEQKAESDRVRAMYPGAPELANDGQRNSAFANLLKINPKLAYEAQGKLQTQETARAKLAKEQQANDLRVKASQGDPAALQQLVGIDFDSWKTLKDDQKSQIKDQTEYTGQAALRISQLPPQEQAAAWDQAIDQGVQNGYTGLADYRGKFSPQALKGAIDNAGLVEKFISLAEPKYMAIPEGGTLVNTRSPQAVGAFGVSPSPQTTQPAAMAPEQALKAATARGYVLPDEAAAIKSGLGANGQAAFEGWLEQNKVKMVTRTGTAPDGRKVVQFSDGTTQYAD